MVVESEKQSAMRSPVSMATAKSDLFASYRTWLGRWQGCWHGEWNAKKSAQGGKDIQYLMVAVTSTGWKSEKICRMWAIAPHSNGFPFLSKVLDMDSVAWRMAVCQLASTLNYSVHSLAAQRMRFFHGKPSKVTGFQRKSGQMFLYINLVRISLYSNWEWQVNSLALGRVHFWLGLLSVNFCSVHKAVLSKIVDLVEVYLINPLLSRFFFLWSPVEMMFVSFWFNFKLGTGST